MMALTNVTALLMKDASPEAAAGVVVLVPDGLRARPVNGLLSWHGSPTSSSRSRCRSCGPARRSLCCPVRAARPLHGSSSWGPAASSSTSCPRPPSCSWSWSPSCAALRRSRLGLSIYAIGSDRLAAFRGGVNVARTRILTYALGGFFACGGLALDVDRHRDADDGPLHPPGRDRDRPGRVSLAGGRGGIVGPIAAAFILGLIRLDLVFLGVNPNLSTVIQGLDHDHGGHGRRVHHAEGRRSADDHGGDGRFG